MSKRTPAPRELDDTEAVAEAMRIIRLAVPFQLYDPAHVRQMTLDANQLLWGCHREVYGERGERT